MKTPSKLLVFIFSETNTNLVRSTFYNYICEVCSTGTCFIIFSYSCYESRDSDINSYMDLFMKCLKPYTNVHFVKTKLFAHTFPLIAVKDNSLFSC